MRNARTNRALFTPHFVIAIIAAIMTNPLIVTRCVFAAINDYATYQRDALPYVLNDFRLAVVLAVVLSALFVGAVIDIAFKVRAIRSSEPARVRL